MHYYGLASCARELIYCDILCGVSYLFVGVHQQTRLGQILVLQHSVKLLACHCQPLAVRGVDDHDDKLPTNDVIVLLLLIILRLPLSAYLSVRVVRAPGGA